MQLGKRMGSTVGVVAVVLALVLPFALLGGCKDDETSPPKQDSGGPDQTIYEDGTVCKRPPLSLCTPPPYGSACKTTYFCPGCTCTGPTRVAACNPINNDCRYFCTGCYPEEYVICDQETAKNFPQVAARCGFCFYVNVDAGAGYNPECNIIGPFDGGVGAQ